MAKIALLSAAELDKERNREAERRGQIAEAVGNLVSAHAEWVMQTRQLTLLQALEKRAQERVRVGVAETGEQVRYPEQVAALETRLQARGNWEKPEIPQQSQNFTAKRPCPHFAASAVDNFPQPRPSRNMT